MAGRRLIPEDQLIQAGYGRPELVRRRAILRETLDALAKAEPPDRFHRLAQGNLERWLGERCEPAPEGRVEVLSGDWGAVTARLTRAHGACFAVLNMANAHVPGGGYIEGMAAQEENLFRRTDCHFRIGDDEIDAETGRYLPAMTRLLSAADGRVYLDTRHPRVCIRGPENRSQQDLGYPWLAGDQVFPFYELRAAAQDLRGGQSFDPDDARRRIAAQLDTLRDHDVRHAVLGASGCGAFCNPAHRIADLYSEEIDRRRADFALIAFAIHHSGYGPDNLTPFAAALGG